MSDGSPIEWLRGDDGRPGMTWNPIRARNRATGGVGHFCVRVSDGCRHCYAERRQPRFRNPIRFAAQDRALVDVYLDEKVLTAPLAKRRGRRIFPGSMTDIFGDWVTDDQLDRLFAAMALSPQHTYISTTKRPERMGGYLNDPRTPHRIARRILDMVIRGEVKIREPWPVKSLGNNIDAPDDVTLHAWPLPNFWAGVSIEDQPTTDERIPILLDTLAAVRWVSAEPLLGPVDLSAIDVDGWHEVLPLGAEWLGRDGDDEQNHPRLDWVVVGGESGHRARPMHPDWARSLRDQCTAAGVAFLFKQHGEWIGVPDLRNLPDGLGPGFGRYDHCPYDMDAEAVRVGKKAAGRRLDGVEHHAFPVVRHGA